MIPPCNFDHNGECLICDCWPSDCAFVRYLAGDYTYETKEQLEQMFAPVISDQENRRTLQLIDKLFHLKGL